jgi:hypothetical protein
MGATYAFEDPGSTTKLDFAELEGKLVLIQADRVEASIRTVHGPKDATVATLHVVDGKTTPSSGQPWCRAS